MPLCVSFAEKLFEIVFCVSLFATPVFIAIAVVRYYIMLDHIKRTNPQRFGRPLRWGLRRLPELEMSDHDDDPIVDLYLQRFRRSLRLAVLSIVVLFASLAILVLTC